MHQKLAKAIIGLALVLGSLADLQASPMPRVVRWMFACRIGQKDADLVKERDTFLAQLQSPELEYRIVRFAKNPDPANIKVAVTYGGPKNIEMRKLVEHNKSLVLLFRDFPSAIDGFPVWLRAEKWHFALGHWSADLPRNDVFARIAFETTNSSPPVNTVVVTHYARDPNSKEGTDAAAHAIARAVEAARKIKSDFKFDEAIARSGTENVLPLEDPATIAFVNSLADSH